MGAKSPDPSKLKRDQLIEAYLPLVRSVARRYRGRGEPFEDLVQVGTIGLIKASDRYDPDRGAAFETFATTAVEGEIRRHLRDRTPSLRIPRKLHDISEKLRRAEGDLAAALGRTPTVPELATALSAEERDIERARWAVRARDSVRVSTGDEAIELPDNAEPIARSDDRLLLGRGARALDERERRVVFLRFHADMTEREIASQVGISQAHVSRVLDGALAKLRAELATAEQADTAANDAVSPSSSGSSRSDPRGRGPDTRIAALSASRQKTADKAEAAPSHSGRFLVRMSSSLHRQLADAAEQEQVSLNRFVIDALARTVGEGTEEPARSQQPTEVTDPDQEEPTTSQLPTEVTDPEPSTPRSPGRALRLALATNLIVVALAGIIALALLAIALARGV